MYSASTWFETADHSPKHADQSSNDHPAAGGEDELAGFFVFSFRILLNLF
jgi:hypothetical protein